ncbi:hypothetical protein KY330_03675 [Candidatus Woesearchaeota archaeon]|nr:hypothetical protein [Candidatus Woesearchaeota archaeon]
MPKNLAQILGAALSLAPLGDLEARAREVRPYRINRQYSLSEEYRFHEAKDKPILRQAYLNHLQQTMPELVETEHMLAGLLYEPTEQQLVQALRKICKHDSDIKYALEEKENTKKDCEKDERIVASVCPTFHGKGKKYYIIFTKYAFDEDIQRYADIRNLIIHELQHVRDRHYGIELCGINLSDRNFSNFQFTGIFMPLLELRAYWKQLEDNFRTKQKTGKIDVSDMHFLNSASAYEVYWRFFQNYKAPPDSEMEKLPKYKKLVEMVRKEQLRLFSGIVPIETDDEIILKINLFGKKETIIRRK